MSNIKREYMNIVVKEVGSARAFAKEINVNEAVRGLWNEVYSFFNDIQGIDIKKMSINYNYSSVLKFAEHMGCLEDIGKIVYALTKRDYPIIVGKKKANFVFGAIRN